MPILYMYMHMDFKFKTAELYQAPVMEALDAQAEGVLCASEKDGSGTIDDLTFGDFQW